MSGVATFSVKCDITNLILQSRKRCVFCLQFAMKQRDSVSNGAVCSLPKSELQDVRVKF